MIKEPLKVKFYQETNGNEPVRKWLKSLDKEVRSIVGKDISTIQEGWPLGMPLVRNMGEGIWEIRSTIPNGIVRVFFMIKNHKMVLLHGIVKKTQSTPLQDLRLAKERAKNVERMIL